MLRETHMNFIRSFVIGVTFFFGSHAVIAASSSDIDKLTTYATLLGRAVACGNSIEEPMRRVGQWIDRKFPPGSTDQKTYLPIFMEGVRYHAQIQKEGRNPDSCSVISLTFNDFHWP